MNRTLIFICHNWRIFTWTSGKLRKLFILIWFTGIESHFFYLKFLLKKIKNLKDVAKVSIFRCKLFGFCKRLELTEIIQKAPVKNLKRPDWNKWFWAKNCGRSQDRLRPQKLLNCNREWLTNARDLMRQVKSNFFYIHIYRSGFRLRRGFGDFKVFILFSISSH